MKSDLRVCGNDVVLKECGGGVPGNSAIYSMAVTE